MEGLVEVALLPELFLRPRRLEQLLVLPQLRRGVVLAEERGERGFRGENAGLDRQVDPFQPRAVQETAAVAEDHEAVAVEAGHGVVAALRDRLRARGDHLPALQDLLNLRMELQALQLVVRVERRVLVVETDHQSDVDDAVLHAVDEGAAERVHVQRKAQRVDHAPGGVAVVRKLPELLHADRVHLRVLARVQVEHLRELFRQRPARPLGQDGHLRADVDARLEVRLRLAVLVDAFVARAHADDAAVLDEHA